MNHADAKSHFADYLEGDLSLTTRERVDAHLDGCVDCAQEVDELERTIRLLRTLPDPEAPPMIAANVMRRIRAGETQPSWLDRMGRAASSILDPSFVLPASAVAAAGLVVMVVQDPDFLSRFSADEARTAEVTAPGLVNAQIGADIPGIVPLAGAFESGSGSNAAVAKANISAARESMWAEQGVMRQRVVVGRSVSRAPARNEARALASRVLTPVYQGRGALRQRQALNVSGGRGRRTASTNGGRAMRVAQSRTPATAMAPTTGSSGGGDARDEWLARGLKDPIEFARFLAGKNLAEQELWVSRLADRAESRGLLDELVDALRTSGDASADLLSDDFAAQAAQATPVGVEGDASGDR